MQKLLLRLRKFPFIFKPMILVFYALRFSYFTLRNKCWWFLRNYPGYFGSTIPKVEDIKDYIETLKGDKSPSHDGIAMNDDIQIQYLHSFRSLAADFDPPMSQTANKRYYWDNEIFRYNDGLYLYCFLRHLNPRRVIEVGSGYTSALMLDMKDGGFSSQLTFIEPYPVRLNSLISKDDKAHTRIIEKKVQDVDLSIFKTLEGGDVLFIDTSHVVKTASELSYIFFTILPLLPEGVYIHIHDIWWPFEYPEKVLLEGHNWNEAYFVRSFLQFNRAFSIVLFPSFLEQEKKKETEAVLPKIRLGEGTSLWLKRTAD